MSEEAGSFLARWSRRKAASRQAPPHAPAVPDPAPEEPAIELPAMESLGADSDYRAFLSRGVSHAVQAQALAIAWASDPVIANFRGMAEYAWDFNAPGYGDLSPGDDAAVWLSQVVRSGAKAVATAMTGPSGLEDLLDPSEALTSGVQGMPAEPPPSGLPQEPVAMIAADVPLPEMPAEAPIPVPVRRHGGAMPV